MTKENNGWISVDDKLPKVGEYVLVYDDKYDMAVSCLTEYHTKTGVKLEFSDITFSEYFADNSVPWLENVTHWQPLPPIPTK